MSGVSKASKVSETTAVIEDLTHDGLGVASVEGRRAFVAGALPGETVTLGRMRRRRRYLEAELTRIVEPCSDRVEPHCPYFGRCGGCALQHMDYPAQVRFKQKVVADAFRTVARLEPRAWQDPITGPEWGYRRRARLGIKYVAGKGRVLVGFRERAAPYITDMDRCPVLVDRIGAAIGDLAETIGRTRIRDRTPQAEVSVGDSAAALVLRVLDEPDEHDRQELEAFGARHGLDVWLQPAGPDSVRPLIDSLAELEYTLSGFDTTFAFEPNDFIQVNAAVNEKMVAAAIEAAGFRPDDRVLDLYCGLGNFTIPIAARVAGVTGVEGDAALVARANANALRNGVSGVTFVAADLSMPDWPFFRERWDVVLLDPARAGAEAAAAAMGRMAPRRIVYVSCHPGTLARDAAVLVREHGYELSSLRVLDMFPHTHHVEAIAVFDKPADVRS